MKICICGGGSLGHVCAGMLASDPENTVNIYTRRPDQWGKEIIIDDCIGKTLVGKLANVSNKPEDVIADCDMVFLCLPGFAIEDTLLSIKPHLDKHTMVGSIISSSGFFFAAHRILNESTPLFGFQRTPYIARLSEYGHRASLLGHKKQVSIAVEHCSCSKESIVNLIEKLFATPTILLNNFYEASLTNSNPILHTGRLYGLWKNWNGEFYERAIMFYKEWDDNSSEILLQMDTEFMSLLDKLPVNKKLIPSLLEYYESSDAQSLTKKISSIPAFENIVAPMYKTDYGWMPDFKSRYFTEDFPFGLKFIKALAEKHEVYTPLINEVYAWGMSHISNR